MSKLKKETNIYECLWKLWFVVCKMVMDGSCNPYNVADVLQEIVDQKEFFFRRLYAGQNIMIDATDGSETFSSSGIFGKINFFGDNPLFKQGKPTSIVSVDIYELGKDYGSYSQLFSSLGEVGEREFEQSQIIQFCREHLEKFSTEFSTIFRLKGGFIVDANIINGRLEIDVDDFLDDSCSFGQQLVVPN